MTDFDPDKITRSSIDPKWVAVISYFALPGWIIAMILNNPRSELATFHIRQSLGVLLLGTIAGFVHRIPFAGDLASSTGGILALILWIIGFVAALKGEIRLVPVLGESFQEWFKGI